MVFIDLERHMIEYQERSFGGFWIKKGVPSRYIDIVKDMYDEAIASVRTIRGETSEFAITVGLPKESTLSPYLFPLVMDELTRCIQRKCHSVCYLMMMLC